MSKDQSPQTITSSHESEETDSTRRRLLGMSTIALGGAGACTLSVPFINSLRGPNATIEHAAQESSLLDIELSDLSPGGQKTIIWRGWPVSIQHRTPDMIKALKEPALLTQLSDPQSSVKQQPQDAVNFHRSIIAEYGVFVTICTHLGCIPSARSIPGLPASGGFFCPCHGSQFDGAGRVLRNMPAPYNLPVPPMHFLNKTTIRLGESKAEPHFSMDMIKQL